MVSLLERRKRRKRTADHRIITFLSFAEDTLMRLCETILIEGTDKGNGKAKRLMKEEEKRENRDKFSLDYKYLSIKS